MSRSLERKSNEMKTLGVKKAGGWGGGVVGKFREVLGGTDYPKAFKRITDKDSRSR